VRGGRRLLALVKGRSAAVLSRIKPHGEFGRLRLAGVEARAIGSREIPLAAQNVICRDVSDRLDHHWGTNRYAGSLPGHSWSWAGRRGYRKHQ
jgi:hypothetical protein